MKHNAIVLAALIAMAATASHATPIDDALTMLSSGRPDEAARRLTPLAESGEAEAQYRLGLLYYTGKGVPENERKAFDLLLKAARQKHYDAAYQLGNLLAFGQDAPKIVADPDVEAARWYYEAATNGHADAQYSLGLLFLTGKGVVKDTKEATHWIQQAAKNGHKEAQSHLGGTAGRR